MEAEVEHESHGGVLVSDGRGPRSLSRRHLGPLPVHEKDKFKASFKKTYPTCRGGV